MTREQVIILTRKIKRYAQAMVDDSWKGSLHPDDWAGIEKKAKKARDDLWKYIQEIAQ